ncbi:hypothetical protein B0T11DRAFT_345508 [Plectosphaerella cucumerina]|uniref:Uncharacterized protein n=1 Tax=Plectosphaerella cucumerina TaxID=40658 RepID=A0A8K0TSB0_9PEZI|nr:hypothetical protein B0T11DRAFT_345508 [Plectosphaerella cucumerina]
MNRFRTKKKVKEESAPRASQDSDSPAPFRLFGKKKQQEEEPKKEFDLAAALPSNDDFRTSLLMTNMSARFSMLREQDDPTTKIGKASDDSVLFPKRTSRLDFGQGLGDIAEIESIKAPAFARIDSFHSSEGSTSGSIMDRAKPTEGNNLFGGRQKIYKIGNTSGKAADGGMPGRALYGDDVAMSSFQRWKQAEKERQSFEDERADRTASSTEIPRAESPPPVGYNRKRETNSTTSSTPSVGRNSTAATSVMSQPTNQAKDWHSTSAASAAPFGERTVTRTRRLYENGLMTDLQESQSSAVTRMDTLTRRNLGIRTPDLSNGPSPTGNTFPERFGDRKILTKASAPNLRSMNPTLNGPPFSHADLGIRTPSNPETKASHHVPGGAPPLSPPISEAGESIASTAVTTEHNKSAGHGMFSKSNQQYDDNTYAQKQIQMQSDREPAYSRVRAESNTSGAGRSRSRSNSSAARQPFDRQDSTARAEPAISTVHEEAAPVPAPAFNSFFFTDDEPRVQNVPPPAIQAPPPQPPAPIQRPSDQDHPAFRTSALPTPLSMSSRASVEPSPTSETNLSVPASQMTSPIDSPTLGPNSGLSGMVRQHMRSDSDASSVYGGPEPTSGGNNDPNASFQRYNRGLSELMGHSNPWDPRYNNDRVSTVTAAPKDEPNMEPIREQVDRTPEPISEQADERTPRSSSGNKDEPDEFARHLADGARRVRERLTSYVESDSRSVSPSAPETREPAPSSRPNPLNLLRSKSSRSSMVEKTRPVEPEPPMPVKSMKLLGIGAATMSSSPSPSKHSFDMDPASPMVEATPAKGKSSPLQAESQGVSTPARDEEEEEREEEGVHAGLRAFRQARRELQKLKELETQQRHIPGSESPDNVAGDAPARGSQDHPDSPEAYVTPNRGRIPDHRAPSAERPSPPMYQTRAPSNEQRRPMHSSRPPSRNERDRSGSEASNGSRSHSRPPRLRTMTGPHDGLGPPMHGNGNMSRPMRSPGQGMGPGMSPGMGGDQWRSPMMSPHGQPFPAQVSGPPSGPPPGLPPGASPAHFDRSPSGNLRAHPSQGRGYEHGQISPISPLPPGPSPSMRAAAMGSGPPTPNMLPSPRRPSQPPLPGFDTTNVTRVEDSMRKFVKKKDISEPTFVSSTSRVPTVNLPENQSRSRSGSRARAGSVLTSAASSPNLHAQAAAAAHAPPLPPLNPKRRNMTGFRPPRHEEEMAGHMPLSPRRGFPQADGHSAFSISDDEEGGGRERRRLRKATSEAHGINVRARQAQFGGAGHAPPPMAMGNNRLPGGMI